MNELTEESCAVKVNRTIIRIKEADMVRPVNMEQTEKRKLQILQGALECFGKKGFHQSSMQEICKKAGLSPGTVYHYFKSKDDIIEHIADREVEKAIAFSDFLGQGVSLREALSYAIDDILGSNEFKDGLQVYMEVVCEAGRNRVVGKKLLKSEELVLKAIRKKLKEEKRKMPGVSQDVLAEFIGGQLELLELYKRYDPSAKKCAQMAVVCKKVMVMLLED